MLTIAFVLLAYLIGSVSFAVLTSRWFGLPDPHTYGSKNPGATNVLRTGNKAAAALTLLGDGAKGWLAVWLVQRMAPSFDGHEAAIAAAAIAVFLGHIFPVFHRFRGGKGVATALGVLLALNLELALGVVAVWIITFYFSRISSISALAAATAAPLLAVALLGWSVASVAILGIALILVWRHRSNIRKLLAGTEGRIDKSKPG